MVCSIQLNSLIAKSYHFKKSGYLKSSELSVGYDNKFYFFTILQIESVRSSTGAS